MPTFRLQLDTHNDGAVGLSNIRNNSRRTVHAVLKNLTACHVLSVACLEANGGILLGTAKTTFRKPESSTSAPAGEATFTDLSVTTSGDFEIVFVSGGTGEHDPVLLDSSQKLNNLPDKTTYTFKVRSRRQEPRIKVVDQPVDSIAGASLHQSPILVVVDKYENVLEYSESVIETTFEVNGAEPSIDCWSFSSLSERPKSESG